MFKLKGTLKLKNDTVQVSDKFMKREFVVTDEDTMYPQDIQFQLTQDKCALIDHVNPGDVIEVSFNLRGKEWVNPKGETKYFNTLDAWRIESCATNPNNSAPIETPNPMSAKMDFDKQYPMPTGSNVEDELPF